MEKAYEPNEVEKQRYAAWEASDAFLAKVTPGQPKYSITIPPPNVTGKLHMGHALTYTVQDALGRWRRMAGDQVLILPGTDHAGIATQNVVEKQLAAEAISRHDIGREKFVERVWTWRAEYGTTIISQLKRLGCAFDWSRERFTLDKGYEEAVLEAFVRFHDQGLIYRGNRLINWCPRCQTVISDIEVEEVDQPGHLWHIQYPFADGSGHVTVATTRPETMLGDTAVAVNPADERYFGLVGKMLKLPLTDREIPLIADDYASLEMGTGAVKVTPAHDPNDYEAGKRNNLPQITVIGLDAAMTQEAGPYAGLDRYAARTKIVEDLEALGLLELVEDRPHRVPTCERCHTVIEPLLSDQWFMKMGGTELVQRAIDVAERDEITFAPQRYKGIYIDWMRNLRDWPLSRQLWWGHRIPIYYLPDGTWVAAKSLDEARLKAGTADLRQDEDVLDTWFSSALWPFATLAPSGTTDGWPTPTAELDYFYPTNVLTTSREILYLWVARMIMAGLEFTGKIPFEEVYIFATVLDKKGRRMSKSLGNGIDPVEMIEKYGADALRFSLLRLASKGQDIKFSEDRIPESRNFGNKLWNATRFVLGNLKDGDGTYRLPHAEELQTDDHGYTHPDLWILTKLDATIGIVADAYRAYDFDVACSALYDFIWNQYCDWYLELSKSALQSEDAAGARPTRTVLLHCLSTVLRLLHPIMPYMTEEIWQNLPEGTARPTPSIMNAPFPAQALQIYSDSQLVVTRLIDSVTALRSLRAEYTPGGAENEAIRAAILSRRFTVTAVPEDSYASTMLETQLTPLTNLARLGPVIVANSTPIDGKYVATHIYGLDLYIPAAELLEGVDPGKESARLDEELKKLEKELGPVSAKLNNPGFLERAAEDIIAKTRSDFEELTQRREKINARKLLVKEWSA